MALCERLHVLTGSLSGVQGFIGASQHFLWLFPDFVLLPGALRKQNEEFVAAQAHRQVASSNHVVQTGGKFYQYLVPGGMAVRVVDLLEAVQVQSEYGQGVPLALRACHFGGQALFREPPVIQTSQRINHGEIAEKVGMALLLGELAAKPLDENCLRNRIDVKKHHQDDQTKNNVSHLDI